MNSIAILDYVTEIKGVTNEIFYEVLCIMLIVFTITILLLMNIINSRLMELDNKIDKLKK